MAFTVDIHAKVHLPTVPIRDLPNAKDAFIGIYDDIQQVLLDDSTKHLGLDDNRRSYLKKMMDVTCTGGKYNRGITVVEVAMALAEGHAEAVTIQRQAAVLGWAIEFMQAHFLVEDDIMDSSITRRGKPCWYRHPGVTVQCAINDGLIVLAWCTKMIQHFLAGHPHLLEILTLFHRVDQQTTMGQLYDVTSMFDSAKLDPDQKQPTTTDYKEFTLEHYNNIVRFKTAYYTYHLPMLLGLAVTGTLRTIPSDKLEALAVLMGEYFQIQDDFLDCFGEPERIGKIGTDIQDVKCSWLAVTFLAHATPQQTQVFKDNYGQHDDAKIATIKKLYKEAKLEEIFAKYEDEVVVGVNKQLEDIARYNAAFSKSILSLWNRTFKRTF